MDRTALGDASPSLAEHCASSAQLAQHGCPTWQRLRLDRQRPLKAALAQHIQHAAAQATLHHVRRQGEHMARRLDLAAAAAYGAPACASVQSKLKGGLTVAAPSLCSELQPARPPLPRPPLSAPGASS